jgi:hypothetical protein
MPVNKKNIEGMSNELPTKIDPWYVRIGWTVLGVLLILTGPALLGLSCGLVYRLFMFGWRIVA